MDVLGIMRSIRSVLQVIGGPALIPEGAAGVRLIGQPRRRGARIYTQTPLACADVLQHPKCYGLTHQPPTAVLGQRVAAHGSTCCARASARRNANTSM